jgi:glycosyltransferase involved in cell wall biosynthesis
MNQDKNPLVSIIVITYNSANFVLETLESVRSQTYRNIELIISDDCSSDDTITICKKWLKDNDDRFVDSKLITAEKNTGIPGNCNRGVRASKGEWVKLIAGDDILDVKCINSFLKFSIEENTYFSVSPTFEFIGTFSNPSKKWISNLPAEFLLLDNVKDQFQYFLRGNTYLPGSAFFIHKSTLIEIGGFLEDYHLVEDRPLLLNWTHNGYFISSHSESLVYHRRHESGLTSNMIFPKYLLDVYRSISFFSKKSNQYLFFFNSIWHLFFLSIQKEIFKTKIYNKIDFFRIKFQPIRLLWLKKNLLR